MLPVQLVWQESERQRQDVQSSLLFEPVPCHHDLTDMDFYVFMSERGGCIGGSCDYAAELFSAERIARLIHDESPRTGGPQTPCGTAKSAIARS